MFHMIWTLRPVQFFFSTTGRHFGGRARRSVRFVLSEMHIVVTSDIELDRLLLIWLHADFVSVVRGKVWHQPEDGHVFSPELCPFTSTPPNTNEIKQLHLTINRRFLTKKQLFNCLIEREFSREGLYLALEIIDTDSLVCNVSTNWSASCSYTIMFPSLHVSVLAVRRAPLAWAITSPSQRPYN